MNVLIGTVGRMRRAFGRCTLAAVAWVCIGAAGAAHAQVTETVILNFDVTNGGDAFAPLLADNTGPSGAIRGLYGTTSDNTGNLFKLTPPKAGKNTWIFSQLGNSSTTAVIRPTRALARLSRSPST